MAKKIKILSYTPIEDEETIALKAQEEAMDIDKFLSNIEITESNMFDSNGNRLIEFKNGNSTFRAKNIDPCTIKKEFRPGKHPSHVITSKHFYPYCRVSYR